MNQLRIILLFSIASLFSSHLVAQKNYGHFKTAIYTRAYEVQAMQDHKWLDSTWQVISSQLKVDKIYLETHRDLLIVDEKTMKFAKKFFNDKGIETAGGITYTIDESNNFETFCYSKPEDRNKAQQIIEYSASLFDEVILDDFFFTSCKCGVCVEAKGDRSWSEYRLALMTDVAKNIILDPAKAVNPKVKIVIKYPNWYDHFQELGFNLETEPNLFDGLHTGTETRDAATSNQHLQPYLGYLAYRYYDHLKPGKNGGGWVDIYGSKNFDRYAEQLWLTLWSKAPEMTLFDYRGVLTPLSETMIPKWSSTDTSFQYDGFLPIKKGETMAKTASHALNIIDNIVGELGRPYGIKSYKPYHSSGEDFLQNYFGMIGLPMDLVPEFPMDDEMVILTEQAKKDPDIVQKIEQRLIKGKDVLMTSGLLSALQERGIRNLVNLEYTSRKALVTNYLMDRKLLHGKDQILIPQIQYATNDSWEIISGMDDELGWPLLHRADYGNGTLYVLVIPENFSDLYNLPAPVLDRIREIVCKPLGMMLQGGAKTSLFLYDNNTFVVESFNDEPVEINVVFTEKPNGLIDISDNTTLVMNVVPKVKFKDKVLQPRKYRFTIKLEAHSFKAYKIK